MRQATLKGAPCPRCSDEIRTVILDTDGSCHRCERQRAEALRQAQVDANLRQADLVRKLADALDAMVTAYEWPADGTAHKREAEAMRRAKELLGREDDSDALDPKESL